MAQDAEEDTGPHLHLQTQICDDKLCVPSASLSKRRKKK